MYHPRPCSLSLTEMSFCDAWYLEGWNDVEPHADDLVVINPQSLSRDPSWELGKAEVVGPNEIGLPVRTRREQRPGEKRVFHPWESGWPLIGGLPILLYFVSGIKYVLVPRSCNDFWSWWNRHILIVFLSDTYECHKCNDNYENLANRFVNSIYREASLLEKRIKFTCCKYKLW